MTPGVGLGNQVDDVGIQSTGTGEEGQAGRGDAMSPHAACCK